MTAPVVVAPRRRPGVVEGDLAGTRVVFHLGDRRLHVLNEAAAAIWTALHHSATVGEVVASVAETFAVPAASVRGDVEHTVERFVADGLVSVGPVPAVVAPPSLARGAVVDVAAPRTGSYAALDARLALSCDDQELVDAAAGVLGPLWCADEPTTAVEVRRGGERTWTVAVGGAPPVSVGSRLAALLRVLGEVNNAAVLSVPGDPVLHAGAVAGPEGVLALPAGSNHGKSTLTTALVRAGLDYLTDEVVAVGPGLEVQALPKSIALDPGSFPLFADLEPLSVRGGDVGRALAGREWHLDPRRVGTVGGPGPLRVVVSPQWRPGTSTRLRRSEPVEALHMLLGQSFDLRSGGEAAFRRLVDVAASVPVYRLAYSDLAEAVDAVAALIEGPGAAGGVSEGQLD